MIEVIDLVEKEKAKGLCVTGMLQFLTQPSDSMVVYSLGKYSQGFLDLVYYLISASVPPTPMLGQKQLILRFFFHLYDFPFLKCQQEQ